MKSIYGIEPTGYTLTKEQWDTLFDKVQEQEDAYDRLSILSRNILTSIRGFTLLSTGSPFGVYVPRSEIVLDLNPLVYNEELYKELRTLLGCPL